MQDGSLPLNMILDQVSRDKGIDKDVLVEAVEAAILTAAKRTFGTSRELEAHAGYSVPVDPKPPAPRSLAARSSASSHSTSATRATISWAMRSPRRRV